MARAIMRWWPMIARVDVLARMSGSNPYIPTLGPMPTIFTRIIDGDIPGTFVWRDERCVAFMSINPMAHGHTLVVPIDEVDHWVDASPELAAHLFDVTRVIARAQHAAFSPERVGVIIAGYEVPHAHIHVIPTNHMGQLSFANAAPSVDRETLDRTAGAIRVELRREGHEHVV
jgi:diadenosine tetraphosphate (Ap4A) HIT family hydrolase